MACEYEEQYELRRALESLPLGLGRTLYHSFELYMNLESLAVWKLFLQNQGLCWSTIVHTYQRQSPLSLRL